jgi:ribonuclease HII
MATKQYENQWIAEGYRYIAGFDEVGRGPLAGPLVVAGVILPMEYDNSALHDSKQISDKKRRELYQEILRVAIAYVIEIIPVEVVDHLNVYQASKQGMLTCFKRLPQTEVVLTDAMPLPVSIPCVSLIKGDTLSQSIAAASILAKVTRDDYMIRLATTYPDYGFEHHKGYGTKQHLTALSRYGVTPEHRRTFAPVQSLLQPTLFEQ